MLDGRSVGAPPFPYPERGQGGTGQAQQYGLGGPQKSGVGHVHIDNVEVAVQTVPDRGQNQVGARHIGSLQPNSRPVPKVMEHTA